MKVLILFFGLCTIGLSSTGKYKSADHDFLHKQKHILTLFKNIHQPSYHEEHVKFNQTYTHPAEWLEQHKDMWTKPEVVDDVIKYFHHDYWLHHDELFSISHFHHKHQAMALFKLFYYAKDFETFYKVAMMMREHMNEAIFVYTVSVAIVHRPDMHGIVLPPIYEIWPWYFYNGEVITEAWKIKQMHEEISEKMKHIHHVHANYSGHYLNLHHEQDLAYYLEDIGINSFHYYYHLFYPSWMDGKEFHIENDHRGRIFFDMYRSLLARWYMERLSHGQGQIPFIDSDVHIDIPFYPSLMYPNGLQFPERPKFADLHDYYHNHGQHSQVKTPYVHSFQFAMDYHRRISDAVDSGVVLNKEGKIEMITHKDVDGMEVIANIIQGTPNSPHPKYYGNFWDFVNHLLGYAPTELNYHKIYPSAMEHPETMMRDPIFYPMLKKIMFFWYKWNMNWEKPHELKDLVWPGISITGVEMDRLITYMEDFECDMSNAVWDSVKELKHNDFHVHVIQQRLNHKPFTYKVHIQSDKDVRAMVKVMIGPKYDNMGHMINMTENIYNFVPFDMFEWHLTVGDNVIKRSSSESHFYGMDRMSYDELESHVKMAMDGQKEWHIDGSESYWLYPHRYMLPMGSQGGAPYQFYFYVYPYKPYTGQKDDMNVKYPRPGTGGGFLDDYPIFYPMDLPIYLDHIFEHHMIPNGYFHEIKVYHRTAEEAGVVKVAKH